jgi:GT2 family glycosyltransferase
VKAYELMKLGELSPAQVSVVAIPAYNEASRIADCLAALALQRDATGTPIEPGLMEIIIFANNCTDDTAAVARQLAQTIPHPVSIVEERLAPANQNAGWARKRAMDLAAIRLAEIAPLRGVILTTDADSRVSPTWLAATLCELDKSVDCVAGYIDAVPAEYLALGGPFLLRGRLEDTYLRYLAEISARCDPIAHDPWPNHRVSSGASLAVTLAAYAAIGGLPPRPVGEDSALTAALARAGFRIRHSMDVCVTTSCRFDGRAKGGAADTMRHRHLVTDAPCDDDMEPALQATRRALYRGLLRRRWSHGPAGQPWPVALQVSDKIAALFDEKSSGSFDDAWSAVSASSPSLRFGPPLRPSDLPRQIAIAKMVVRLLKKSPSARKTAPGDKRHHEESNELAF